MIATAVKYDEDASPDQMATPGQTRNLWLYLLPIVACPVLLVCATCFILPTRWFALRSADPFLFGLAYGETLSHADCKILIYGDSSAEVGLSPALISQRTGLSTCNIAEPESMTRMNGTAVLDRFLAHNAPPRYMVFFYSPENTNPRLAGYFGGGLFEAFTYRLRQGTFGDKVMTAVHDPSDFFKWCLGGMNLLVHAVAAKPDDPSVLSGRAHESGQLPFPGHTLKECDYDFAAVSPDKDWIAGLRKRYGGSGTTVVFDTMPIPVCDPNLTVFPRLLGGITDNPVRSLPLEMYVAGGRHASTLGAQVVSNLLADQIVALQAKPTLTAQK